MQRNRTIRGLLRAILPTILAATIGIALLPGPALAGSLVNRASIQLRTIYLLRASLNYRYATISATERITIRNVSGAPISKVNLSVLPRAFGELVWIGNYRVDGRVVTAAWTNNSNLAVQLGRNVAHDEVAVLTLGFRVRAGSAIGTSLEGRLSKANGIMQVSHWFPIVSDGHGARYPGDSQYTLTARKIRLELTTDSTAIRIAAPGRRVAWSGRYHVYELLDARDFAFGASPYYRAVSGSAGGVTVVAYYTTGAGATALAYAKAALVRFESVFGEYQWPRYVIAQTGRTWSGNEYPGIVFLGAPLFSNREVVAHETAHQWWYAMAGNDQLREPWLDEGLAEFSAAYFFGGFGAANSWRPVNSTVYEFPNAPASLTSDEPGSYDQTVYFRSAEFLEGLRFRMGNDQFFAGLRALFDTNRNGVMTTREFYDVMAERGAPTSYLQLYIRVSW